MILQYSFRIFPRLILYYLARNRLIKPPHPILLNFSVTNKCQSKCTICNIWKLYEKFPEKEKQELKLWEIKKIFKSMQPVFLLNICGGEPSLREDLDEICKLACQYIKPTVIHFPTNCLSPKKIEKTVTEILKKIPPHVQLTVKMSLDGIDKDHDKIRGVKGNFKKLLQTHDILINIRKQYQNLYVDAGTTICLNNLNKLNSITDYVNKNLKLDNFLHEIADTRGELFNVDIKDKKLKTKFKGVMENLGITPTGKEYEKAINLLIKDIIIKMKHSRKLSKITQALRLVYYKRAAKVMKKGKRIVPCYAGISNAHLNPWGGLWICNVQAFNKEMGNIKNFNYNFNKLWHSKQAYDIRRWVKSNKCHCPLVGQAFLDTIMNPKELIKVFWYYLRY